MLSREVTLEKVEWLQAEANSDQNSASKCPTLLLISL